MRYILHYTNPGDVVFDGFCGTGMTGVAAQMCGNSDHSLQFDMTGEFNSRRWGKRKAVLADLSPAATYISSVYNTSVDVKRFESAFVKMSNKANDECAWMYQTKDDSGLVYHVNYTVWSDVFICPHCGNDIVFWDCAVDKNTGGVLSDFACPRCHAILKKKDCERAVESRLDDVTGEIASYTKQIPVLIAFKMGKKKTRNPLIKTIWT